MDAAMSLWWKARAKLLGPGIKRNVLRSAHGRHCLLMYRVGAFRSAQPAAVHQNIGQARELAQALSECGYNIDVVDFDEHRSGLLTQDYDLVIDLNPADRPLYEGRLAPGARTLCYITGSNPAFSNTAELERIADLRRRRGVSLQPRRQTPPFSRERLESFDAMLTFANTQALSTYGEFRLPPVHHLVNNGYDDVITTDPRRRDRRRFLFLASTGQVHKGLDLLLELFAGEPGLELVVCSPFAKEHDFVRAYRRELFDTANIHAAGFVNVKSERFRELQSDCGTMILPSCSEAQCGSVTVAMSFGIPIVVSRECDFEDPELRMLPDCLPETLKGVVHELARQPEAQVVEESERTLLLARASYRPADYARSVRQALTAVLESSSRAPQFKPEAART
jgi:glycosyltransferase involved in cell wall biosynthesis